MIQVIKVAPMCEPEIVTVEDTLESWQKEVGGYIQCVYPFDDPVTLLMNEEGKLMGLTPNRLLYDDKGRPYDYIAGTFFIIGLLNDEGEDDGEFHSLSNELIRKYMTMYEQVEIFI